MSNKEENRDVPNEDLTDKILISNSKYDSVIFPEHILKKINTNNNFSTKISKLVLRVFVLIIIYFLASSMSGYLIFLSGTQTDNFLMIQFLTGYLILSIFSNLFGFTAGLIGGFIADIIYQIVSVPTIQWGFVINASLIGFFSGLFRYNRDETVPNLKIMRFFYSLILTSLFSLILINSNISIGLLLSQLISFVFLSPVIIILIDYVLTRSSDEQNFVYKMVLTHHYEFDADHSIPINLGGYYVFLCTRCTGTIMGIIIGLFIERLLFFSSGVVISPQTALILCIILPLPGIIDWGTQKMLFRKSNDIIRIFTGLLLGVAMHMISFAREMLFGVVFVTLAYFGIFTLLFVFGTKKLRRKY